jgi:hypothetical protein
MGYFNMAFNIASEESSSFSGATTSMGYFNMASSHLVGCW